MKRVMTALAVVVATLGLVGLATAGDYHVGTTLECGQCHVMHGTHSGTSPTTTGNQYLLKASSINGTCLACHDGRTDAPDVLGPTLAMPTDGRLAGALNSVPGHGYDNVGDYGEGDGHTLWSTDTPPGFTGEHNPGYALSDLIEPSHGLQCSDCHSVHGSANYRNMRNSTRTTDPWRNMPVTYAIGTFDNTKDVFETSPRGYGWNNVQFGEPVTTASAYGAWCMKCHDQFHGDPASPNITVGTDVVRHPTAGVDVSASATGQYNMRTHKVKLMDQTGAWTGTTAGQTPSCFSCHKSHGNKNDSGLIWFIDNTQTGPGARTPVGGITEEGDVDAGGLGGTYRDLCRSCHGMGRWPTGNPININPGQQTAQVP